MAERTFTKAEVIKALEYFAAMQAVDQQNGKQPAPKPKRERKKPEQQAVAGGEA